LAFYQNMGIINFRGAKVKQIDFLILYPLFSMEFILP
jgi:hypothetical protein